MNHFLMGKCPKSEKPYQNIPACTLEIDFDHVNFNSLLISIFSPTYTSYLHQEATKFDEAFQWICHFERNQM